MDAADLHDRLREAAVLPVVTMDAAEAAEELASILVEAGLGCVEITLRTTAAEAAIARAASQPAVCVGAGTVRNADQARAAAAAGARFVVTPGTNPAVIETCHELSLPVIPGVATPSEVERAVGLGCTVLKLFPAAALGGSRLLHSLAPVYPEVKFVPTGGVTEENMDEYLRVANVLAVAGSWITAGAPDSPADRREMAERAARARELAAEARGRLPTAKKRL